MRNRTLFKHDLHTSGINFINVRTGNTIKGINCYNSNKPYVSFFINEDILSGDILCNTVGEKLHIIEILPIADYKKCFYESEYQFQKQNATSSFVINADKIENSIIGTQSSAIINLNEELSKMESDIKNSNSNDKEELLQIISLLRDLKESQSPIQKGIFAKFSSVMERNSWITGSIAGFLLSLLQTP